MVARFAPLLDLLVGKREPEATGDSTRDTIPDEESGLVAVDQSKGNLVERHLQQYHGTTIEILDAEVAKQKFRYRLYRLLKNDFLKPIYTSISANASLEQIEVVADERKKALDAYLKILENPMYQAYLGDIIMIQLSILIDISDWTTMEGINSIKQQIAEILETPVARDLKLA